MTLFDVTDITSVVRCTFQLSFGDKSNVTGEIPPFEKMARWTEKKSTFFLNAFLKHIRMFFLSIKNHRFLDPGSWFFGLWG